MKKNEIQLSIADINGEELNYIKEAFETNWVTTVGPQLDGFESDLKSFLQTDKTIVALSSGTAAIHLGLIRLGIKPGDEVICQDFTFAASVNPVKYLGANPILVDSELETWNVSPFFLENAIKDRIKRTGKKPKAIIPVDLYGMPAKLNEIQEIAQYFEIPVLEDAAESLGSYISFENFKQFCGTFGRFACLSFNGNKIITTSGGGALICPSIDEAVSVKFLSTQARDEAPHYQHSQLGYNYRLSNICAAIGRGQIKSLQSYINKRRFNNQLYREYLADQPELEFQNEPNGFYSNYWLTTILFPSYEIRERVRLSLLAENIESRPLWKPMHLQPLYANVPFYGDGIDEMLFNRGLCLPSGSVLKKNDIIRVCESVKSVIK